MILKNKYENNPSIKYIATNSLFNIDSENSFSNPNTAIRNDIIIAINNVLLIRFNG